MFDRRKFMEGAAVLGVGTALLGFAPEGEKEKRTSKKIKHNPIGVSTYSFWQFNGPKEDVPIESCIEKAAAMGFDGIELLLVQMTSEENNYLQNLKKRAFHAGLDLMGPRPGEQRRLRIIPSAICLATRKLPTAL
jgi:hypothetical protein